VEERGRAASAGGRGLDRLLQDIYEMAGKLSAIEVEGRTPVNDKGGDKGFLTDDVRRLKANRAKRTERKINLTGRTSRAVHRLGLVPGCPGESKKVLKKST